MPGYWEQAVSRPDDMAVVDRFGERTWAGYLQRVLRVAAALGADGLQPGDHIAMYMSNRAEFMELASACQLSGLAHYKCPRSVDFEEQLPRHPTGKLYKRLLRYRCWAGTGRPV